MTNDMYFISQQDRRTIVYAVDGSIVGKAKTETWARIIILSLNDYAKRARQDPA